MKREDQDIEQFFREMRKEESATPVPRFAGLPAPVRKVRLRYWLPAVAAVLLLTLGLWFTLKSPGAAEELTIETTAFPVGQETMSDWESPSASLLGDF